MKLNVKYGQVATVYFPKDVWLKINEERKKSKLTISKIITDALRGRYELSNNANDDETK